MSGSYIYEVLLREPREGSKFITPPQNKAEPPSGCHDLQHQETITHTLTNRDTQVYIVLRRQACMVNHCPVLS